MLEAGRWRSSFKRNRSKDSCGKLTVVTGPNGGGKTSLAKVIAGLNAVTEGTILLDDIDITDKDITERAQLGVSYAFQQPVRFKGVAVRDLLELAAGGTINEENVCSILAKVGLCTKDYIDREVNASLFRRPRSNVSRIAFSFGQKESAGF